ncbi:MAG: hypothetical protein F4124_10355 [Acidimicrobiia bacterium]|nr:hypothetical protein [Acidimicrobiia bacterium]MYH99819.1 hypothetical protein [Acidimicrobiia bacterium]
MDILQNCHSQYDAPLWTSGVRQEIVAASSHDPNCNTILAQQWLGQPIRPDQIEEKEIYRLQVGLRPGQTGIREHRGEAECIYFAEQLGGGFATDDAAAYDFALRYSNMPGKVVDTIDILREAVAHNAISDIEADFVAQQMEGAGRIFRKTHRGGRGPSYFR